MIVTLSESELYGLLKNNKKEIIKNPLKRYRPLTDPYTYWVDENGHGTDYHCASCGYKTHDKLDKCPACGSDVIDISLKDIHDLQMEIW